MTENTAKEQIKLAYENMDLKNLLIKLPKDILEKELSILKRNERSEQLKTKMKFLELGVQEEVFRAINPETGKELFSSEFKRKTETQKRLSNHQGFQKALKDYETLMMKGKTAQIELSYMKRIFRAAEALGRLR